MYLEASPVCHQTLIEETVQRFLRRQFNAEREGYTLVKRKYPFRFFRTHCKITA